MSELRMPIRDSDLRAVVVERGVRPGDPLWRHLAELQKLRDRDEVSRRNGGTEPSKANANGRT